MKITLLLPLLVAVPALMAQDASPGKVQDERKGPPPPPPPHMIHPLLAVLDTNRDGQLSAEEIAAASQSLAKLDKNADGVIDRAELHPKPPKGMRPPGPPPGGPDGEGGPPPPPPPPPPDEKEDASPAAATPATGT